MRQKIKYYIVKCIPSRGSETVSIRDRVKHGQIRFILSFMQLKKKFSSPLSGVSTLSGLCHLRQMNILIIFHYDI